MDKYVEFYQDLLEDMDKEFMLKFHRSTQKQLYIMRCAYEKDPSHLLDLAGLTCAFNILIDLINDKYYNQLQSPTKGNQLDDKGDIEESSSVKDHHQSEEYMEEWNQYGEVGEDIGNLYNEQKDESSLGPQDEKDDFVDTCVREGEATKNEVEDDLTILRNITPHDSPFENLRKGDPISPLVDYIEDHFCIEKDKWEIVGPQIDLAPIYDTDKEDDVEADLPFHSSIIYDDISIDTLGKENCYFTLHEEGQLEVINSPFRKDPIFDTNNDEIDKAPTYPPYDSIFKSLEPLNYDFEEEKPIEFETSPSPLLFSLIHHLESSTNDSLTPFHMTYNYHGPFHLPMYDFEEEPSTRCIPASSSYPQGCECNHSIEKPIGCPILCPKYPFSSHHDLVASTKHNIINNDCDREFSRVIIHSTIMYLEGKPPTSRSIYFPRAAR